MHRITGNEWIQRVYYSMMYASYVLYAIALFGISSMDPTYLSTLNMVLKYFIIGVLMVRFNPWIETKSFNEFDRSVVFSAAVFLLTTTTLTTVVQSYMH
jgi:hypothetical protein